MKKSFFALVIIPFFLVSCLAQKSISNKGVKAEQEKKMMVRIAEIEIHPQYLEEYIAILKEESEASVRLEPGVISLFPMFQKENPTQIRLLEIYAYKNAYESHLQTPHFKHYKTTTLSMVKSLQLIEMKPIDTANMNRIFKKLPGHGR